MKELLSKESRAYLMGIGILLIIAFHFCYYSALLDKFPGFLFGKGYVGVDLFFFLSAYGLCHSYEANSLGRFYLNRARRLFPMYFLFLAVVLFFFGRHYSDPDWLLFLFQATGIAAFRQVDVEWFIPALICVYALFPLLFLATRAIYGRFKYLLIPLVLALALLSPALEKFLFPAFAYRFGIIITGIATYFAVRDSDDGFLAALYSSSAAFAVLFRLSPQLSASLILPLLLLGCSRLGSVRPPLKACISFVGKHSLEIYLAQNIALNHYFLGNDGPYVTKCLLSLAIIAGGAVVLHFFQKCFYKLLERGR